MFLLSFGSSNVCRKLCMWLLSTREANCNITLLSFPNPHFRTLLGEARTGTLHSKFQGAPLGSASGAAEGDQKAGGGKGPRAVPPAFPARRSVEPWHQPLCFPLLSKRPEPALGGPSSESEPQSTETPLQAPVS